MAVLLPDGVTRRAPVHAAACLSRRYLVTVNSPRHLWLPPDDAMTISQEGFTSSFCIMTSEASPCKKKKKKAAESSWDKLLPSFPNPVFATTAAAVLSDPAGDRWAAGKKTPASPSVNRALIIHSIQCQGSGSEHFIWQSSPVSNGTSCWHKCKIQIFKKKKKQECVLKVPWHRLLIQPGSISRGLLL